MNRGILFKPAHEIAAAIKAGKITARAVTKAAIAEIVARTTQLGAFTDTTFSRALSEADTVDLAVRSKQKLPPLAGVPYAVKNLFDVAGVVTRA